MRYFAIGQLVMALLLPVAALAQSQDAASLLALHRQYVGWQFGDGTFTSMHVSGTATYAPTDAPQVSMTFTELRLGALYRTTTVNSGTGVATAAGFTGRLFWGSSEDGFPYPLIGQAERYAIARQLVFNEGILGLPTTMESPQSVNGVQCSVVRVTPPAAFPIDLYINPTTGAFERIVIDPDGGYETQFDNIQYSDALPGKRVISGYKASDGRFTWAATSITPNAPVSADELHPPAQTVSWTFGNPRPFPVTITHFRVLLDATINGVQGRFILDTGADGIYLDPGFAARARIHMLHALGAVYGVTGSHRVTTGIADSVAIGGNTLSNVVVHSMSFTDYDYRGLDGQSYDGLIGYPLFGGAVVTLRFSNSTMAIANPQTADLSSAPGMPVALDLSGGIPMISSTLDDGFGVDAMLDTGNPGIFLISPDLVSKYHFPQPMGGCLQLRSLTLGTIRYVAQGACENGLLFDREVLAGFDLLKHFDLIFDYSRGEMIMDPLPQ